MIISFDSLTPFTGLHLCGVTFKLDNPQCQDLASSMGWLRQWRRTKTGDTEWGGLIW